MNRVRNLDPNRDGTINWYMGFLRKAEEFELLNRAAEAIRRINQSGYLTVVVTNQPGLPVGRSSGKVWIKFSADGDPAGVAECPPGRYFCLSGSSG